MIALLEKSKKLSNNKRLTSIEVKPKHIETAIIANGRHIYKERIYTIKNRKDIFFTISIPELSNNDEIFHKISRECGLYEVAAKDFKLITKKIMEFHSIKNPNIPEKFIHYDCFDDDD